MSEHKTTFNYIQYGNVRRATLVCSACELTMEIDCLKLSPRMAEREFYLLHEKANPTTLKSVQKEIRKENKSKKQKPVIESTENDPEIDNPEEPDGGWLNEDRDKS